MRCPTFLVAVLLLTGCASIFGSSSKLFDLQSAPGGADVYLDGVRLGTTPVQVKLDNHKTHTFTYRLDGYKEASCTLEKGTGGGWVVADILMGLVPVIIDAATNSWSQTKGSHCTGNMERVMAPVMASAASPAPTVQYAADGPPSAITAPPPVAASPPQAPQAAQTRPQRRVGYDQLPTRTTYVGDGRTKRYYSLGCGTMQDIPFDQQYFYVTEAAAQADGFRPSADC
jgi:hypothetical protein